MSRSSRRRSVICWSSATAAGLRFLPFAKALLRLEERAHAALDRGNLAIGASSNIGVYLLQPLVRAFGAAQPSIGPIDIRIGTNPETARRLEDAEVDIALMEWWDDRPGFEATVWRREKLVVIVPPEHPWARRRSVDKAMLLREPMIGGEPGTGTARLLQRTFGVDASSLKIGLELGSTEAVKQAVRAGLGISITLAGAVRDDSGEAIVLDIFCRAIHHQPGGAIPCVSAGRQDVTGLQLPAPRRSPVQDLLCRTGQIATLALGLSRPRQTATYQVAFAEGTGTPPRARTRGQ